MKIIDIVCAKGKTGFYFDDQEAIKKGAINDGLYYLGKPIIEGFDKIRQPGECISIMIILEDGQVAYGDCIAVQYSGTGGRDRLFLADDFISLIEGDIRDKLIGENVDNFKILAEKIENMKINGKSLHTAIRYGLTQAVLDATSKVKKVTMAEIIKEEYKINVEFGRIPIFTQSGDDRYLNADKMIIKEVDILPHGLFNNVEEKLGLKGEKLLNYIIWLKNRIIDKRSSVDYTPEIQIDVYGTIGELFKNDIYCMTEYLIKLEKAAKPFNLKVEGPVDAGSRKAQMEIMRDLRINLEDLGSNVKIVADEWCNTLEDIKYFADNKAGHIIQIKTPDLGGINNSIEAILYCNKLNIGSYIGGTCNGTTKSSEVCTNIAIACKASQILARPGMGVDEAIMIVNNEMNRTLALANR